MTNRANRQLSSVGLFALLVAVGVASRLVSHEGLLPPNCQAIAAIGLFAGWYFSSRLVAVCVPLVAMMASDWVIGGHDALVMATVYVTLAVPALAASLLRGRWNVWTAGGGALGSAVLFFVTTNFAVWAASGEHALASLGRTYLVAVPFFRYMLAGDLAYTAAVFGAYALASSAVAHGRLAGQPSG